MKKLQLACITLLILVSVNTNAQFLEKLKKRTQEKIEREAENRAQRRINKKIDKAYDKAEDEIDGKNKKTTKKQQQQTTHNSKSQPTSNLPSSYSFDWKYTIQMETKKGDMHITYFLKPNAKYFGSKIKLDKKNPTGNMFMIMDIDRKTNLILMETDGQKILHKMPFPDDMIESDIDDYNYTITKTDTKTILGYFCQGFKIDTKEATVYTYISKNAPISFNHVFSDSQKNKPKGFDPKWIKDFEDGLMMEMDYISKKKKKYNTKMTCIALKKEAFTVHVSEYKSFGF